MTKLQLPKFGSFFSATHCIRPTPRATVLNAFVSRSHQLVTYYRQKFVAVTCIAAVPCCTLPTHRNVNRKLIRRVVGAAHRLAINMRFRRRVRRSIPAGLHAGLTLATGRASGQTTAVLGMIKYLHKMTPAFARSFRNFAGVTWHSANVGYDLALALIARLEEHSAMQAIYC